MSSPVLLCADGSDLSLDALRAGVELLGRDTTYVVVTVLHEPDPMWVTGTGLAGSVMSPHEFEVEAAAAEAESKRIISSVQDELGLEGSESHVLRGRARRGDLRARRVALREGHRRRDPRPWGAQASDARLGLRPSRPQRAMSGRRDRRPRSRGRLMVRLAASAFIAVLGNAVALIVTSLILDDVALDAAGFFIALAVYTVAVLLMQPLVRQVALKNAPALLGSSALVATLVSLIVTVILTDGLRITGAVTWVMATVLDLGHLARRPVAAAAGDVQEDPVERARRLERSGLTARAVVVALSGAGCQMRLACVPLPTPRLCVMR